MAITKEYVEGIGFEVVKQKYYNANKVNAIMDELKAQIFELIDENDRRQQEIVQLKAEQKDVKEAADLAVAAANDLADQIVCKAKLEADDMIKGAQKVVAAARLEEAQARDNAEKIRAKAEAIDVQVARIISNARAQQSGLSDKQMDSIDNILAQIDELSMAQETRLLKIRQLLMGMVTEI